MWDGGELTDGVRYHSIHPADPAYDDAATSHCPGCESRRPWVRDVVEAYRWTERGGAVRDLVSRPSAALIEGVMTLADEVRHQEAEGHRRAAQEARRG